MEWIKAVDHLPPNGVPVIAFGVNEYDKERTIRAYYARPFTIEGDDEYGAAEYNEEKDEYYLKEGWYESNECEEIHWMVTFEITHWMPFPDNPKHD